jgi:MFS family permease
VVEQPRNRWGLVLTAGLVSYVVMLEINVVNVALPVIQRDLGNPPSVTQWVVVGYLLPVVSLVLPAGRWLDRVDRRWALVFAAGGFAVASSAAGAAPSIGLLVAARLAQGSFAAVLFALMPALAAQAVRAEARGRAMSVLATLGPLGGISGPALGGLLLSAVGWRPIFLLVTPICAGVVVVGLVAVPRSGVGLRPPDRRWLADAALLATAVGALLGGLTLATARAPGWLALALVAVPALAVWRRSPSSRPVLDLVRIRPLRVAQTAAIAVAAGYAMMAFLMPFYLQRVLGVSPAVTGLTVLAYPVAVAATGPVGGFLADRWTPRSVAVLGALTVATAVLLMRPLSVHWTPFDLLWRLALGGVGTGLFGGPVQAMAMSAAPRALMATTAGTFQLARSLGFALGPPVATMAWALSAYRVAGMRTALLVAFAAAATGAAALGWSLLVDRRAAARTARVDEAIARQRQP